MKKQLYKTILFFAFIITTFVTSNAQTWAWAKSGNGTAADEGYAVATDANGNVYITGFFRSPTIIFGSYTLTNTGIFNMFLTKYDANGNVLWAKSSISSTRAEGNSISTDANGNVYVMGNYFSPTVVFGSYTLTNAGISSVFLTKYDANGNVLWATSPYGGLSDSGNSVSTDSNGNAYVTGWFSGAMSFGLYSVYSTGVTSMFLIKYDTNGNMLWVTSPIGSTINPPGAPNNGDGGCSASTDASGNIYVTGFFSSPTIIFGSYTLTNTIEFDTFLAKYDSSGNVLWVKSSIGSGNDVGYSVSTDANGNAYITGNSQSGTITFGSYTINGGIFLVKYDANGNVLWAKNPTGGGTGNSLSTDANNIYMSGSMLSNSLVLDTYTLTTPVNNPYPWFVVRFDLNGNANYAYAHSSGGIYQNGITVDKHCNAYIVGDFKGTGSPSVCTIGTNVLTSTSSKNVFVAKLSFTACVEGINELSTKTNEVLIFPNPNNGNFKIQIDNEIHNGGLILVNSLGQKVYEQKIIQGENTIANKALPAGLYHYMILQNKEQVGNGKLIIE